MSGLSVLIADDHGMVLDLFQQYLADTATGIAVRTARTLDEALRVMAAAGPFDVVLLDLNMPGMNGTQGLRRAIDAAAGRPVAILTGTMTPRLMDELMTQGAAGIVLKTTPLRSLPTAIRFMAAGETYLPRDLLSLRRGGPAGGAGLSDREAAVLSHLAEGRQNKEIANALGLAEPTIKMHVKAICRKLGAQNRTRAVVTARDLGLV